MTEKEQELDSSKGCRQPMAHTREKCIDSVNRVGSALIVNTFDISVKFKSA